MQILEHIKSLDLTINENVYAALITGHARANDIASAEKLLYEMRDQITPGLLSFTALLCAYAERGDMTSINKVGPGVGGGGRGEGRERRERGGRGEGRERRERGKGGERGGREGRGGRGGRERRERGKGGERGKGEGEGRGRGRGRGEGTVLKAFT